MIQPEQDRTARSSNPQETRSMPKKYNDTYLDTLRYLSDRILEAQRPIRILDAVKWDKRVKEAFFASGCKEQPQVTREYYIENNPLGFDPADKKAEFHDIERHISRRIGQLNPLSQIMRRICREYQMVVRMLEARGTLEFSDISQELYGSASDVFHAGDPSLADLGRMMESTLANLLAQPSMQEQPKTLSAQAAVEILNERLTPLFPDAGIRVILSDGIAADAAAGTDYIKINKDAMFSPQDIDVLEVHEGWVHLGTTLNGMAQPYCTFLGKGPPSVAITQEGLAVLTEILTLRSSPTRLNKLINRVRAITLAESGATFLDVFNYMCEQGLSPEESWNLVSRVYRGSTAELPPFTKDISYIKGFILGYNYLRVSFARSKIEQLPLLFCGKVMLEDLPVYEDLAREGVVIPPKFIPPHFRDLKGLGAWMSFSRFIGGLDFNQLEADYNHLF